MMTKCSRSSNAEKVSVSVIDISVYFACNDQKNGDLNESEGDRILPELGFFDNKKACNFHISGNVQKTK